MIDPSSGPDTPERTLSPTRPSTMPSSSSWRRRVWSARRAWGSLTAALGAANALLSAIEGERYLEEGHP
jgi:hypothetical protein